MKRIFAVILCVMMLVPCLAGCGVAKEELVIGYTDYKPMNYIDENGKLVGFDTEFAEAVCKKLGYEPKFQIIEWNNKYMELAGGTVDCVWNGFTYNCADDDGVQRADKVDF
ncbi:MAG: transporter substrate-binding domain-containing protein [Clostridia bacterium]|nr:transporter substrate-binding domain-containing protein [Clostridia bacterium]